MREDASPLSDATLAKVDAFMKQGGLIMFDTRDHDTTGSGTGAQGKALTSLIGQLDIPPLEPVPKTHVLTKSFYLMRSFPGRWDGGTLWVEAEPVDEAERSERSRRTDGVSSIVDHLQRPRRRLGARRRQPADLSDRAGRRSAARNGVPRRRQHRDVRAHRQLQGRSGACACPARALGTVSAMSWSIEFIPFVPWSVLWALAALGAVLLALLFWRARRGAVLRDLELCRCCCSPSPIRI